MLLALLFLLLVFVAGLFSPFVLYLAFPRRPLVPFALVPILGAVGAFVLCGVCSEGMQHLFHSQRAINLGFLGGYLLGGLLGGGAGFWVAWRLVFGRPVPNRALQRTASDRSARGGSR